ncbi:MAG: DNA-binding protein WhiA [Clostridiales bacterium]|nr:DNA-binding protein WhiA [Clostridiales bacterium]
MSINGLDVKRELVEKKIKSERDRLAIISGLARSCLAFTRSKDSSEFELCLDCQTELVRDYAATLMRDAFMIAPKYDERNAIVYGDCDKLLKRLLIVNEDGEFESGIPERFKSSSHFARGVFLGCGSMSAPQAGGVRSQKSTGYHLEFSFGSESFADAFMRLLGGYGIVAKKSSRAEKAVVYVKDSESVSDCLALLGAEKTVLRLNETVAALAVKRDVIRRINCEVANMGRTAQAAVGIIEAVRKIEKTHGLDSLDKKLKEAAAARLDDEEAPLSEIAARLNISKSGLKHRFDRIIEIANAIKVDSSSEEGEK